MVISGTHKSNLLHPVFNEGTESLDKVPAAIEVPPKAGDAAFFVDCMAHGSVDKARRTPGVNHLLRATLGQRLLRLSAPAPTHCAAHPRAPQNRATTATTHST